MLSTVVIWSKMAAMIQMAPVTMETARKLQKLVPRFMTICLTKLSDLIYDCFAMNKNINLIMSNLASYTCKPLFSHSIDG